MAKQNVEEARRLLNKQKMDVEAAEVRWKTALRSIGLPDSLEPTQLKEVSQRSERIAGINLRLEQYQAELAERNKELSSVTSRIDQLLEEIGIVYQSTDPSQRLQQLKTAITEQRRLVKQRKELHTKHRALRRALARATRDLDSFLGRKQRALAIVGAQDDDHYRRFALQHDQLKQLADKRRQLNEQIAAGLGTKVNQVQIEQLLETYGANGLERRWDLIVSETEQLKNEQTQLHQQRGKISQEIKTLSEDRRLDEARLELNCVAAQLGKAQRRWQVLAVASQMLESIRATYEAQRQPETLREASYFLEKLTGGQYIRIWTKMVGEELLVDNAKKETLRVELLSRGTREAVYLGLRLALVGAYARRGANLPMVLDDVLVNFDTDRARSAAKVLRDFAASGYQLLMFTCHDHIRDLFYDLGADVRVLPHHKDVAQSSAVPTAFHREASTIQFAAEPPQPEILEVEDEAWHDDSESKLQLTTEPFDADLQFELSAVESDEKRQLRLGDHLVYVSDDAHSEVHLSDDDAIWSFRPQPA